MDSDDSLGFGFSPDNQFVDSRDPVPPAIPPPPGTSGNTSTMVNNNQQPLPGQMQPGQMNMVNNPPVNSAQNNQGITGDDIKNTVQTAQEAKSKCCTCFRKCTSSEWWQKFFDVDIKQFGKRCGFVFYFWSKKFYSNMGKYGDLWGPIWIPVSLLIILTTCTIFSSTIASIPKFDVNMVIGYAISLVFYQITIPGILYLIIRCSSERYIIRMTQLLCIYGYSMVVYIPIGLLLLVPPQLNGSQSVMNAITIVLWAVLTIFSILFILFTLFGTLKKVFFKKEYWTITIVFGLLHAGMCVTTLMCVILNGRI